MILYMFIETLFYSGPNTLTFIISAESVPTKCLCMCYGIAAAFRMLSAIPVQLTYLNRPNGALTGPNSTNLGNITIISLHAACSALS